MSEWKLAKCGRVGLLDADRKMEDKLLVGGVAMKTGRPPVEKPKSVNYTIRLDEETEAALLEYCEKHGVKRGEAIRTAIRLLIKRKS